VIELCHLVSDVIERPQPEALAGHGLLMPGGNATEVAMAIATTACHQRSQTVAEAFGGRPATVRPREAMQIRRSGQIRQNGVSLGVPVSQARDWRQVTGGGESLDEAHQSILGFVPANRIDFRKIPQDLLVCERSKVASRGDVSGIAFLPDGSSAI
jgi:hypothetical protein